ncbi:redoxin family protein [Sporosarcina sp.]|uniref:redoxin family protein n=1 Tax=Sporosarcina sp. TaxID=49982 RepID=UPI0026148F4D|nr:redoxin family protein [Sporosarcina sp.]
MLKKFLILIVIISVLGACSNSSGSKEDLASQITMNTIDGKTVSLADFEGKKVYVKFWASWCPICLAGLEEVNTLAGEENDFEVLTVVAPSYNNEMKKEEFINWYKGMSGVDELPVLLNDGGSLAKEFNVKGYPTSAFLDKNGQLIRSQPGHLSNEKIKEAMALIE